jgi:hypothetical protein
MTQNIITAGVGNRYVYVYKTPDGQPYYVGKGTGPRMRDHIRNAKKVRQPAKTFAVKFTRGLLNKGQQPVIEKLISNIDDEFALFIEQEFIRKHGRRDIGTGILTNCTDGGESIIGLPLEVRERINKNLDKGASNRFVKGQQAHNKGVPPNPDAIEKQRQKMIGRKASDETRAKMSAWQMANNRRRGVVTSKETKQKQSAAKKGKSFAWMFGPLSEEHKSSIKLTMASQAWVCPHCKKSGKGRGTATRWHFDNCKTLGVK